MRKITFTVAIGIAVVAFVASSHQSPASGPYKVTKTVRAGGDGGFEDLYADVAGRRLYIPRSGPSARIAVFDLDTLASAGEVPSARANDVTVDPKSGHGFASSKPVLMFDTKTLQVIKTIDVDGLPDEILFDPFNERVYAISHRAPNATVINATDGSVVGTIDMDGGPEKAVSDEKGTVYFGLEDKNAIAVIDAGTLKVTHRYDLMGKCDGPSGLAMDLKNRILFAACRDSKTMVILTADDGNIITTLPIGTGTDDATFNPNTMEAFSPQSDGTLTVIKENSPTSFTVEQTVQTMVGARTIALDTKTNQLLTIAAEYGPPPAPPAAAPPPPPAPPASTPPDANGGTAPPAGTPAPGRGGRGRGGRGGRGPMIPDSFTILVVGT